MMQRLTEYISVYEKTHRYWAIAKSRASQINYIEGVYHGIVRSVLKVEGHEWAFCDDESNVSFGKERCCFRGVLTMDSPYLNKDVSDYPFGSEVRSDTFRKQYRS